MRNILFYPRFSVWSVVWSIWAAMAFSDRYFWIFGLCCAMGIVGQLAFGPEDE